MSLSAPGVTSVSTPTTDVMESLTAAIAQMSRTVLPGPQGCATTRVSFSVNQTEAASHLHGSVTVIQTAKMAVMSTTPAHLAPALPRCSVAIMETACFAVGFAMGTTTAET